MERENRNFRFGSGLWIRFFYTENGDSKVVPLAAIAIEGKKNCMSK